MKLLRRSILVLVLVCLGCSAQLAPPSSELTAKIERQVRATYSVPASVKIIIGQLRPSDFTNYDAVTITIDGGEKKPTYEFLAFQGRQDFGPDDQDGSDQRSLCREHEED